MIGKKSLFLVLLAGVARARELGGMLWGCGVAHFGCDQLRLPDREKREIGW